MTRIAGKPQSDGKSYDLDIDSSGAAATKLTGRNVQELTAFNALAIADVVSHDSNLLDVSNIAGRKCLHVVNSLNQSVTLSLVIGRASGASGIATTTTKVVNASTWLLITASDLPGLLEPVQTIKVKAICSVAPTVGSLSVYLEGVQV